MKFTDLGLSAPLLQALTDKGYTSPSPVQEKAIPLVLAGHDLMAAAQTGTGKTAAFVVPMLQRLAEGTRTRDRQVRALVLTPTRELAAQVHQSAVDYGARSELSASVVFGGVKINPQIAKLKRGSDILVATPGRLLDLHQQGAVAFDRVEILVLDEADRMLDMGFIHDIRRIVALMPKKRQTLMFSATFSGEIRRLAEGYLNNPKQVEVAPANATADSVEQWIYPVDKKRKPELLSHLVRSRDWHQVLVFTRTKHGANKLTKKLEDDGIRAEAIHGNKSQNARTRALDGFKQGRIQALIATDIAARGLDIAQLPQVVNFDLPNIAEDYVHRIGRTGRAGASGHSYSLVSADEADYLYGIERLIRKTLPREEIDGYEPEHALPAAGVRPPPSARKPAAAQRSGRPPGRGGAAGKPGGGRPGGAPRRSAGSPRAGGGRSGGQRGGGNR
ncbi:DEAD/DEAH box helicase [Chromatocurvus halotolerans]|uniref:DEAD-box ATP-dependent RNA helicase RhpA n=1 Tax=Chromatocurvus halotolerans TaxID=1132028 RepID=A0A4V2SC08_9GAMM|nr:DEAD/DEAH box helicase [Chromatocurvus halotolerans]TCO77570.1 ATP-dependent RNA helicase RhlE [Chromatocurvus halotolerans]